MPTKTLKRYKQIRKSPAKRYKPVIPKPQKFEKANAYWIDPNGKIMPVHEVHIAEVFRNPEAFKLTKEYIEDVYKQHNEPLWSEGNAREEILLHLINDKGFIRIRSYRNAWVANANPLSNSQKDALYDWAKGMVANGESKYSVVDVNGTEYSMEDLARHNFQEQKKRKPYVRLEDLNLKRKII